MNVGLSRFKSTGDIMSNHNHNHSHRDIAQANADSMPSSKHKQPAGLSRSQAIHLGSLVDQLGRSLTAAMMAKAKAGAINTSANNCSLTTEDRQKSRASVKSAAEQQQCDKSSINVNFRDMDIYDAKTIRLDGLVGHEDICEDEQRFASFTLKNEPTAANRSLYNDNKYHDIDTSANAQTDTQAKTGAVRANLHLDNDVAADCGRSGSLTQTQSSPYSTQTARLNYHCDYEYDPNYGFSLNSNCSHSNSKSASNFNSNSNTLDIIKTPHSPRSSTRHREAGANRGGGRQVLPKTATPSDPHLVGEQEQEREQEMQLQLQVALGHVHGFSGQPANNNNREHDVMANSETAANKDKVDEPQASLQPPPTSFEQKHKQLDSRGHTHSQEAETLKTRQPSSLDLQVSNCPDQVNFGGRAQRGRHNANSNANSNGNSSGDSRRLHRSPSSLRRQTSAKLAKHKQKVHDQRHEHLARIASQSISSPGCSTSTLFNSQVASSIPNQDTTSRCKSNPNSKPKSRSNYESKWPTCSQHQYHRQPAPQVDFATFKLANGLGLAAASAARSSLVASSQQASSLFVTSASQHSTSASNSASPINWSSSAPLSGRNSRTGATVINFGQPEPSTLGMSRGNLGGARHDGKAPSTSPISSSTSSLTLSVEDAPFCKICHNSHTKGADKLISPCKCSGTMQFVHCSCLLKWLEISDRGRDKPISCELCAHEYTWHKRFMYSQLKMPKCPKKDLIYHLIFVTSLAVMLMCLVGVAPFGSRGHQHRADGQQDATSLAIGAAAATSQSPTAMPSTTTTTHKPERRRFSPFGHHDHSSQSHSGRAGNGRLGHDDKSMLIRAASFFLSFFMAIYAQTKARSTLYSLIVQFFKINQTYYIAEYDHGHGQQQHQQQQQQNNNNTSASGPSVSHK